MKGENLIRVQKMFEFDENFQPSVFGVDEAGRGPGAGNVFAACVCFFKKSDNLPEIFYALNDSKKLSCKAREELFPLIVANSLSSVAFATVEEIEKYNILNATFLCMKRAVEGVFAQIKDKNATILVDGNKKIKGLDEKNIIPIVKGDLQSASIAAASILAKVSRDHYMTELAKDYPQYFWEKNKGYLTKSHIDAIKTHGITKHHRKSFLKNIINIQKVDIK